MTNHDTNPVVHFGVTGEKVLLTFGTFVTFDAFVEENSGRSDRANDTNHNDGNH